MRSSKRPWARETNLPLSVSPYFEGCVPPLLPPEVLWRLRLVSRCESRHSPYMPREGCTLPVPKWKRMEMLPTCCRATATTESV